MICLLIFVVGSCLASFMGVPHRRVPKRVTVCALDGLCSGTLSKSEDKAPAGKSPGHKGGGHHKTNARTSSHRLVSDSAQSSLRTATLHDTAKGDANASLAGRML
mmetsp:Transcript_106323/g.205903  ORF Transcript_106323/g.205903 Transcript_106323/m.205903 type:complete len:105 (-) Transcript_106323:28-342(-)